MILCSFGAVCIPAGRRCYGFRGRAGDARARGRRRGVPARREAGTPSPRVHRRPRQRPYLRPVQTGRGGARRAGPRAPWHQGRGLGAQTCGSQPGAPGLRTRPRRGPRRPASGLHRPSPSPRADAANIPRRPPRSQPSAPRGSLLRPPEWSFSRRHPIVVHPVRSRPPPGLRRGDPGGRPAWSPAPRTRPSARPRGAERPLRPPTATFRAFSLRRRLSAGLRSTPPTSTVAAGERRGRPPVFRQPRCAAAGHPASSAIGVPRVPAMARSPGLAGGGSASQWPPCASSSSVARQNTQHEHEPVRKSPFEMICASQFLLLFLKPTIFVCVCLCSFVWFLQSFATSHG